MSFAQNFAAGQQMAQTALQAFQQARMKRDLGRVADAQPQTFEGYTAQDGDQLRAMAEARDADGNPFYTIEDNQRGGLQVRNNFSFAGPTGEQVAPGSVVGLAPRPVTEFLGQRVEGALSPERIEGMRYRAKADVVGRHDPVLGMQMRRDASRDERDAQRFEREGVVARQQDWRFGNEQTAAQEAAARKKVLDEIHQATAAHFTQLRTNPDGTLRDATPQDALNALNFTVGQFVANGEVTLAMGAMNDKLVLAERVARSEAAERTEAVNPAIVAAAAGNFGPAVELFNRFVPVGPRMRGMTALPDGRIQVDRVDASGRPVAPEFFANRAALAATMGGFANTDTLVSFMADQLKIEQATLAQQAEHANRLRVANIAAASRGAGSGPGDAPLTFVQQAGVRAYFKALEDNPNMTPEQMRALQQRLGIAGIIPAGPPSLAEQLLMAPGMADPPKPRAPAPPAAPAPTVQSRVLGAGPDTPYWRGVADPYSAPAPPGAGVPAHRLVPNPEATRAW